MPRVGGSEGRRDVGKTPRTQVSQVWRGRVASLVSSCVTRAPLAARSVGTRTCPNFDVDFSSWTFPRGLFLFPCHDWTTGFEPRGCCLVLLVKVLLGVACEGVAGCCLRRCYWVLLVKVLLGVSCEGVAGYCLRRCCWVLLGVAGRCLRRCC